MPWLENLLHTIGESPLFLSVGALILIVLLLSAILRLAKLALFAGLVLVAYVGYLHYSGGDVPREVRTAERAIEQSAREAGKALKDNAQVAGEAVRTAAENVGERLEQGFDHTSVDTSPIRLDAHGSQENVSGSERVNPGAEPDSTGSPPEHQ